MDRIASFEHNLPSLAKTLLIIPCLLFTILVSGQQRSELKAEDSAAVLTETNDSTILQLRKLDSIRTEFNTSMTTCEQRFRKSLQKLDSIDLILQSTGDTVLHSNVVDAIVVRRDSINEQRAILMNRFQTQHDSIKAATLGRLNEIELTPGGENFVTQLTEKVNMSNPELQAFQPLTNLQTDVVDLPSTNGLLPENILPETSLDLDQFNHENILPGENVDNFISTTDNLNADILSQSGNIETYAGSWDGMTELSTAAGEFESLQKNVGNISDPSFIRDHLAKEASKQVMSHFGAHDAQVKAAMEKVTELQSKFGSIKSLDSLPKRKPNAMKGKRFFDRSVVGLNFQYQEQGPSLIDVNPYFGYRWTGRVTTGMGWNQRIAVERKTYAINKQKIVYGPRVYVDVRAFKSYWVHVESEMMWTEVTQSQNHAIDDRTMSWVNSTMVGIRKHNRITKNLFLIVLLQYNLTNRYFRTPYIDRVNSRMGLEYKLHSLKFKR